MRGGRLHFFLNKPESSPEDADWPGQVHKHFWAHSEHRDFWQMVQNGETSITKTVTSVMFRESGLDFQM